ncbi:MBL fold metallo-hydrolase, partial [Ensifer sp. T173]
MRIQRYLSSLSIIAIIAATAMPVHAQSPQPQKDATEATKVANGKLLQQLPFSDTTDFEDAKRGSHGELR